MSFRGIDQYGDKKKKAIATPDQLKKAESILEPIKLNLGINFKDQRQDIEDIQSLRDDLKRLNEGMNLMSNNLLSIQNAKNSLQISVESMTFKLQCPDLKKKITSIECEKASKNGLCKYGLHCHVRQSAFKEFFQLE